MTIKKELDPFFQANYSWDLETLYSDLGLIKGKYLTPVEKKHLRGLLCGYSPTQIAEYLHKSIKGVETDLCNTVYKYVKAFVGKCDEKMDNWRNIAQWIEEAGYKIESKINTEDSNSVTVDILVKKANITLEKNILVIDLNLKLVTQLSKENYEIETNFSKNN